jgi:hypothetical protein
MDQLRDELRRPGPAGRTPAGLFRALGLAALVMAAAACASPSPSFEGLHPTKEQAAQAVADALRDRDARRLQDLALSADEFRTIVWPELPASRPEMGMPVDYAWSDLQQKSAGELAQTMARFGGQSLMVERVEFAGQSTPHGMFQVHRDSVVWVRDAAGRRHETRLFGSMVQSDAGWKVYSYIVD